MSALDECYSEKPSCELTCVYMYVLKNRIGGVMVGMFTSSVVDREFESRSGKTKHYEITICCFSAEHATLRSKNQDWLARDQNNVSTWSENNFP